MNETNNQPQTTEINKKMEKPGLATKIGLTVVGLATAAAVLAGNGGEKPQVPEQSTVSAEPNVPAAQNIQEGTVLVDRPNSPRHEAEPKPVEPTEAPSTEVTVPQPEVTVSHDKHEVTKEDNDKPRHLASEFGDDVVVLTPPADGMPIATPETPPTSEPNDTPTPVIVP
jgi:hypothetical protein